MSAEDVPGSSTDEAFLERLQTEVEAWQRERIVSPRQAGSILARYGLRHEAAERGWRVTRMTAIFAMFGAILVGVGIILFVAANRQEFDLPRGVEIALMLGAVLFLYALGYLLRYESRFKTVGGAVIFLGAIMYGAAIFVAGLVYNVKANDPSLPLYWFLGVVPLAYVPRSSPILDPVSGHAGRLAGLPGDLLHEGHSFRRAYRRQNHRPVCNAGRLFLLPGPYTPAVQTDPGDVATLPDRGAAGG